MPQRIRLFGPLAALCLLLALPHHQALTGEKRDPKARAFRFTVTGDNTPHRDIFHHVLSEMKRCLGSEGAFHISVGDYSTASETFSDLTAVLGKKVRWHPVVGNHDLADKNIAWLRRHFERFPKHVNRGPKNAEKTTYSLDYREAHFIVLNVYYNGQGIERDQHGRFVAALHQWLKEDLERNRKPVIFVFTHPAPIITGLKGMKPEDGRKLWRLLEEKRVTALFCGHTHKFKHSQFIKNGVWQIDVGNAGSTYHSHDDGQTFVDVQVKGTEVSFNVWRGGKLKPFRKAGSWRVDMRGKPVRKEAEARVP